VRKTVKLQREGEREREKERENVKREMERERNLKAILTLTPPIHIILLGQKKKSSKKLFPPFLKSGEKKVSLVSV
jgi:hypothetical protein